MITKYINQITIMKEKHVENRCRPLIIAYNKHVTVLQLVGYISCRP